jgi:hypothetical protein
VVTKVEGYSASAAPYYLTPLGALDSMEPGGGYWVYATNAASWTITN